MKKIEITVLPDGTSRVETKGFSGGACREASRFLEQALGQRQSEQLSADFYQSSELEQHARERP